MSIDLELGAESVVLPPGRYVIGDPCYHIHEEEWDRVLDESDYFIGQCWAHFTTKQGTVGTVVAFSPALGDGVYLDGAKREYPVDAGLIGIIPLEDVAGVLDLSLAHVHEFTAPFTCRWHDDVITFGYIDIDTDPDVEDDRVGPEIDEDGEDW